FTTSDLPPPPRPPPARTIATKSSKKRWWTRRSDSADKGGSVWRRQSCLRRWLERRQDCLRHTETELRAAEGLGHDSRTLGGHPQQRFGWTVRTVASLFPRLQRRQADADHRGEIRLGLLEAIADGLHLGR